MAPHLHRLSEADQSLLHAAVEAAWTEEMREARTNAYAVQKQALQASSDAARFLNDDDMRHVRFAMMLPWQEQVLSDTESELCGLTGFYANREG
jgi:rRNA maturation endonuclease Nob1